MSNQDFKVLITGASGKFGSLALTHLIELYRFPASQIIAGSRRPDELDEWRAQGVDVRTIDFDEADSLAHSFEGADKLLLISTDNLNNDARIKTQRNATQAAKQAGIGHIIYTSMPQPEDSLISFASVHLGTEDEVKATGANWTILRNNWYFENLLFTIPAALQSGKLYSAAEGGKIAYISRSDLAQAAAAALVAGSVVENRTFELSGIEALTISEIAAKFSKEFKKPIEVVEVSEAALIEGIKSHGMPDFVATAFASFDAAAKAGQLGVVTQDYKTLVGKEPLSFDQWFSGNKGLFA